MNVIASTKILCPTVNKRHAVSLLADGSLTCDCADGLDRGGLLAGRIMLGGSTIEGVRGCGALVALVQGAGSLLPLVRGSKSPDFGLWGELVHAYGVNPVFIAALDRAERADPMREAVRTLLLTAVENAGYKHALGKRRFRSEFRAMWDVSVESLNMFVVSCFDDDPWSVPYAPDWKEQIGDAGLSILDKKVVVGRAHDDASVFYAITTHENGQAHWVRPHKLTGKKLVELP